MGRLIFAFFYDKSWSQQCRLADIELPGNYNGAYTMLLLISKVITCCLQYTPPSPIIEGVDEEYSNIGVNLEEIG